MAQQASNWGSNVPVSMPEPVPSTHLRVDLGGFCVTPDGLNFDMTEEDRTALLSEAYRPEHLT